MIVPELLLIALLFSTAVALIGGLGATLTKQRLLARQLWKALGIAWGAYLVVLLAVALATPQRVYDMNQDECFNRICFAALKAERVGSEYVVTLRITNRAQGREERDNGVVARLWSDGKYFDAVRSGDLSQLLRPGQAITTQIAFALPPGAGNPALVLEHGITPAYLVIGESPLFRRPPIIRLRS